MNDIGTPLRTALCFYELWTATNALQQQAHGCMSMCCLCSNIKLTHHTIFDFFTWWIWYCLLFVLDPSHNSCLWVDIYIAWQIFFSPRKPYYTANMLLSGDVGTDVLWTVFFQNYLFYSYAGLWVNESCALKPHGCNFNTPKWRHSEDRLPH